ncbi:hypothetical protein [Mycolicibacterium vanbaalenii]|uniref:hypothetical protein n=1 Tax=Mycolicibacterium vanbaalenii TaxID=110539 RepID=UPI00133085E2
MLVIGRPPAAPAAGTSGAAAGGMTGGGTRGGTTGGGANGGTTGGTGGGANGGTTGGIGGGANGGTTGGITGGGATGGGNGPGRAIGTPDISESGAHATAPAAAGTSPAEVSRHSYPPAWATPGLNARAILHSPAPTAATLMLSRSKTAINHQLLHSQSDISAPTGAAERLPYQA